MSTSLGPTGTGGSAAPPSTPTDDPRAPRLRPPVTDLVDAFGLTHVGHRRDANADHFLVASFHRAMRVHASSLAADALPPVSASARGYLLMVADGVGGMRHVPDGSAQATDTIARLLLEMRETHTPLDAEGEAEVVERLRAFVQHAHEALLATAAHARVGATATTLTIAIALWPRAIILHAGDSRCYRWRDGVLECLTTDQTMAQALIAAGALQPTADAVPRLRNVLVSALGASQLEVEVVTDELRLTDRWLLCTDGLTRHVSDAEIAERLGGSGSAEAICQDLLALALARGGEDNVTVVAGRLRER